MPITAHIFIAPTCTITIITLKPYALNVEFHHFISRFNKIFITLQIPLKEGFGGERRLRLFQRHVVNASLVWFRGNLGWVLMHMQCKPQNIESTETWQVLQVMFQIHMVHVPPIQTPSMLKWTCNPICPTLYFFSHWHRHHVFFLELKYVIIFIITSPL
jgi:hypothetical protein